eukprot:7079655-Karenia_brevis.AAC.1
MSSNASPGECLSHGKKSCPYSPKEAVKRCATPYCITLVMTPGAQCSRCISGEIPCKTCNSRRADKNAEGKCMPCFLIKQHVPKYHHHTQNHNVLADLSGNESLALRRCSQFGCNNNAALNDLCFSCDAGWKPCRTAQCAYRGGPSNSGYCVVCLSATSVLLCKNYQCEGPVMSNDSKYCAFCESSRIMCPTAGCENKYDPQTANYCIRCLNNMCEDSSTRCIGPNGNGCTHLRCGQAQPAAKNNDGMCLQCNPGVCVMEGCLKPCTTRLKQFQRLRLCWMHLCDKVYKSQKFA